MEDAMKKTMVSLLIIGLVFFLGSCNDPDGSDVGGGGNPTDVTWDWGTPGVRGVPENSPNYPGIMPALSGATMTGTFGEIALYNQVIIDAYLYADEAAFNAETPLESASGLGHFKLLSGGDWEADAVSSQVNNMNPNGETTGSFSATVKPINLLVQTSSSSGVGYIEIRKVTLKLDTGIPVFEEAYNNGGGIYMSINGNKITFINSTYSDAAVRYDFPQSVIDAGFEGKTVSIAWEIEDFASTKSYQIQVQAANGPKDYNGRHPTDANGNIGQFYFTLNNKLSPGPGNGTISVTGNALLAATAFNSDGDPNFPLTAIRINNNGKNESELGQMEASYTLIIKSITVQ
jgi:hypothetical protein